MVTKEGKIKTLKEAKKWLNEQERVDTPQVSAKRWKAINLQHDGREIRLRDSQDFGGNAPSSAATRRTGVRVTSRPACSPCCRKHGSRESPRRSQESHVQPHGQEDAPQGVSYKRGGLDKEERHPGCQAALPA